ncbi:MAG: FecR domain-containing protein [Proteobacteria bacterium]|nr:FecR domain-containing protein [Pseudomonadota bacterium]
MDMAIAWNAQVRTLNEPEQGFLMNDRRSRAPGGRSLLPGVAFLLLLSGPVNVQAADAPAEFGYIAQPGDTLIGLGKRLLRQPTRWHEVQLRNQISNEYRIKPGSTIRIPYAWLKVSTETASVAKVAGTVTSASQPVAAGQSLSQGSVVETGPDGSVAIDLADGSRIVLHKSSSLRLSEMQRVDGVPNAHDIQLQLPDGHLDTLVKPHRDVGRFEIVTPTAVSGVRGTVFRTAASDSTVTTETLEGVVAVSASGETVDTRADFGTRVDKGSPPLKPVPLLPAPDLSAVQETNQRKQLHLEFPPLAGAKSYHVQVSGTADFQTFALDVRSEQPVLDTAALPDGAYWLRVRGVDSLGLEGHDTVKSLTQQTLPEPPKPPPPAPELVLVTRHDLHFQWSAEPNQQYRVQVARDPQFQHILADQTQSDGKWVWRRPWPGQYYIRVETLPAAGTTPGTPFVVPVPLWVKVAVPIVIVSTLLL